MRRMTGRRPRSDMLMHLRTDATVRGLMTQLCQGLSLQLASRMLPRVLSLTEMGRPITICLLILSLK